MSAERVLDATAPRFCFFVSRRTADEGEATASMRDEQVLGQGGGAGFVAHRMALELWDFDADDDDACGRETSGKFRDLGPCHAHAHRVRAEQDSVETCAPNRLVRGGLGRWSRLDSAATSSQHLDPELFRAA